MATNFYFKKGITEVDIEATYGVRVMSVRGLEPPTPKALYTRDWATENGSAYYVPANRVTKSSEVVMTLWIEDDDSKTALEKYRTICDYLFDNNLIQYRDTLQGVVVDVIYNTNKPSWYQFAGIGQIMSEITLTNPTGLVTLYVAP